MSDQLFEFTDDTLDATVSASQIPVLIDFWAPWCGPCNAMSPVIAEVAAESHGQWLVGKCNIQENPHIAGRLGIRSIPALVYFFEGQCKATLIGTQSKQAILEKMKQIID